MKVLLLNGSPKANGNTAYALSQMAEVFTTEGVEAEILQVGNQPIRGCIACGSCRVLPFPKRFARNRQRANTVSPLNVSLQMRSGSMGSSNRVQIIQLSSV